MPEPTVTVRMKETADMAPSRLRVGALFACALIQANLLARGNMNQSTKHSATYPGAPRIALVSSAWHRGIVTRGTDAIHKAFAAGNPSAANLDHFEVPGAFEIPLHAMRLARSKRYDAVIACGLVVNGGIYRHEFVAAAVIDGLMRVQLDTDTPVFSAVLTPRDFHESAEHEAFFREHLEKKGAEVARACLETLAALRALPAATTT